MPCGTYRYKMNWECRSGRLNKLSIQTKPNTTRDYGSESARARLIRRRTSARIVSNPPPDLNIKGGVDRAWPNARVGLGTQHNGRQAYGPLFGMKLGPGSGPCACTSAAAAADRTNGKIYRANHGSSSDVTYWKRIHSGTIQLLPACWGCTPPPSEGQTRDQAIFSTKCNFGRNVFDFNEESGAMNPRSTQCAAHLIAVSSQQMNGNLSRSQFRNAVYSLGNAASPILGAEELGVPTAMDNPGTIEAFLKYPKQSVTVGPSMRYAGGPQTNAGPYSSRGPPAGGPPTPSILGP